MFAGIESGRRPDARAGTGGEGEQAAAGGGGDDWPLRFWSAELLFSREARVGWVEPDLARMLGV